MGKIVKYAKNPALAYRQGARAGRSDGLVTAGYFAVRALYNVIDDFVPEENHNELCKAFDEELNRILNEELAALANGEDGADNIQYAVAIVNNLREKMGLERY